MRITDWFASDLECAKGNGPPYCLKTSELQVALVWAKGTEKDCVDEETSSEKLNNSLATSDLTMFCGSTQLYYRKSFPWILFLLRWDITIVHSIYD